jgi:hypothetical protein
MELLKGGKNDFRGQINTRSTAILSLHSTAIMIEGPGISDSSSGGGEHLMLTEAEPAECNEGIHGRIWYVDVGDTGFCKRTWRNR